MGDQSLSFQLLQLKINNAMVKREQKPEENKKLTHLDKPHPKLGFTYLVGLPISPSSGLLTSTLAHFPHKFSWHH